MWKYENRLQYPINIKTKSPALAKLIIDAYGGPDGEAGAALRYLSQRYTMPDKNVSRTLTDIGTEELGHCEMVCAIVRELTRGLSENEIENSPFAPYYVEHTTGLYPVSASGVPFSASAFQSKGDAITDLFEDMAAEQKARTVYDNLLRLVKDSDVAMPLRFLRAREIVHFQRFGESLRLITDSLDSNNYYACNIEFD